MVEEVLHILEERSIVLKAVRMVAMVDVVGT
jgi:hypothetical protein